jgi:Tfp pilus assembly protein PilF
MALFPFVLLLYAWWRRGGISGGDLKAATPFLAISLVLGFTTIFAGKWFLLSHLQSTANPQIGGLAAHLALAGQSITFYFSKCVWPMGMIPIYPKWPVDPASPVSFLPWPIIAGVMVWLWRKRAGWGRHALLGLGYFLIMLAPFIGLNSVSYMGFTWVMDHFVYLPMVGLIGLAVAAVEDIDHRASRQIRPVLAVLIALTLTLLAGESYGYAGMFIGPEKLWSYTVERNPTSWLAYNNLGNALFETGRLPEAIDAYQKALQLNPNMIEAHNNLGLLLARTGHPEEAIENYQLALKFSPHFALAQTNLANALASVGRVQEAVENYQQALLANPHDTDALAGLARLKARMNHEPGVPVSHLKIER